MITQGLTKAALAARKALMKKYKKPPKSHKRTPKKEIEGVGDMAEPSEGIMRGKGRRAGIGTPPMSLREQNILARKRARRGAGERAKSLAAKKPGSLEALGAEYDGLTKSAKRAEQDKGKKSKFWKLAKHRGKWAKGGQVVKKYAKGKQVASADWMQGLSQKEIDEILGKPTRDASGVKRHTKRKKINKPKKKKVSIRTAKTGGQVMKKAAGGKMSHVGLYPAEEARSGTMSEAKRKKYQRGGPIHHNTSRENRLEELGRVDAEKAYTPQGRRNLKDEKKRIVRGLKKGGQVTNGNDFVSQFYEISTDT
jgi:hypothetical protein